MSLSSAWLRALTSAGTASFAAGPILPSAMIASWAMREFLSSTSLANSLGRRGGGRANAPRL